MSEFWATHFYSWHNKGKCQLSPKWNAITWGDFGSLLRSWWIIQIRAMLQVWDVGVLLFLSHTHTHTHTHTQIKTHTHLHRTFCTNYFLLKTHSISKTGYYSFIRSSINIKKHRLIHSVKPMTPRNGASRVKFTVFTFWLTK